MRPRTTVRLTENRKRKRQMRKYHVAEHFASINGEGRKAGQLAYFIRFKGCGLSCSYCDTAWAKEADAPSEELTASKIYDTIKLSGINNVTLTGGEPLIQEGIKELIDLLLSDPLLSVEIETSGSVSLSGFIPSDPDARRPQFTMDYKLPSSGMEIMMRTANFDLLTYGDTVKFVAGNTEDLERARDVIDMYSLKDRCSVYISPVFGQIGPDEIVGFMKANRMNDVNLQLQMHKIIWDPEKRGV